MVEDAEPLRSPLPACPLLLLFLPSL